MYAQSFHLGPEVCEPVEPRLLGSPVGVVRLVLYEISQIPLVDAVVPARPDDIRPARSHQALTQVLQRGLGNVDDKGCVLTRVPPDLAQ